MNPIYSKYKERFIQISGRNRSLFLKDIVKKYSYDIGAVMESRNDVEDFYGFLWHNRRNFPLIHEKSLSKSLKQKAKEVLDDSDSDTESAKSPLEKELASLKYLQRESDEIEKETGRSELYIGYPFAVGNLSKDIPLRAPIMLFPVRLEIEKDEVNLVLIPNQPVTFNKAFVLAYTKEHNIKTEKLLQEFDPLSEDAFPTPADAVDYLIKNGFKMKYARRKGLIPFDASPIAPCDGIEVKNMAVIGRFPLANSIYDDYLLLEKYNLTTPGIDALLTTQKEKSEKKSKRGKKQADGSYYAINDLDYTQENALAELNRHGNIVIYGPPGTGKSQTIVNIISDALCKNKRVLVVSQKRAALDVVFNRLGKLNGKAVLIPDPEKDKLKFYERLREMHARATYTDNRETRSRYQTVETDINREISTLQGISDTLFSPTEFGLTLQEMYAASYNIGKGSNDYLLYGRLLESPIIARNYTELSEDLKLIRDKNLVKLYLTRNEMVRTNEMVTHILPNIDMHELKEAEAFLAKVINKNPTPFDVSKYPYSRYLTTFYLEKAATDRKSVKRVANIITDMEHPALSKVLTASAFPLLWPVFPFAKTKYDSYREDIMIDLNIALDALMAHEKEYEILKTVLDDDGYALAIGGLLNGNVAFLKKLAKALDNYVAVRDMNTAIANLPDSVFDLLRFASENAHDQRYVSVSATLSKILPIRIYHEIAAMDKLNENCLSKTVTFDNMRARILALKADQRELAKRLANDRFSQDYFEYYCNAPGNKDFLFDLQKPRALRPIRQMLELYGEFLLRLFPCWLAGPEVVSTIFPLKRDLFDVVVFDEASQVFIESALPSIYRGTQIVIAGDNKQLRPSAGFVKRYFGDDTHVDQSMDLSTQAALEVESLLDLATARYYPVHLTYHYRSDFAELIDFSNAAFYGNKLQIAPNITKSDRTPPIERIKVKGMWQNRHNHEEAVAVVKLVRTILRERKNNESIGIVTFNVEQKEYIEDLLDQEADKIQAFRRQLFAERNREKDGENLGLFVKNLENVQGEERDIIIFSVGYAKNDYDRVVAQFGSLSMEGGENRLNVAVTRAKKKIYVVTSIEPEELDRTETTKNIGPKLLRKYLTYVRAVSDQNPKEAKDILRTMTKSAPIIDPIGAYEMQIKAALEQRGYEVDVNLGNTEYKLSLGVYDPELRRYVLGIECDYQAYHSSESLLERDVYRIKFLESRGWNIVRVWSRDWWLSPGKVLDELTARIERQRSLLREKIQKNI